MAFCRVALRFYETIGVRGIKLTEAILAERETLRLELGAVNKRGLC